MEKMFFLKTLFVVLIVLIACDRASSMYAQELTLEQIKANLLDNPPNTGDPTIREQTILALDDILKDPSSRSSQSIFDFYAFMMRKVKDELIEDVTGGANIWMMYNHGFIIKTPETVFAFDLVDGYDDWQRCRRYRLPTKLLQQINVLFISHSHNDHDDGSVILAVRNSGGEVIWGSGGDSITVSGLHVKIYFGLHSVVNRIYEVTTPSGLKIIHTGDNQTSRTLPEIDNVDVMLLNAWVNESGTTSAVVGMRNCIAKIEPAVMIPGHVQELNHDYIPGNPKGRAIYEWPFMVDDVPISASVKV